MTSSNSISPCKGSQFSFLGVNASPYFAITFGVSLTSDSVCSKRQNRSIFTCVVIKSEIQSINQRTGSIIPCAYDMNMENVPISLLARYPPCQSTIANAREDAKCIEAANKPRSRAPRTDFWSIFSVSFLKCSVIESSITNVFTVFAPVIPSLKFPVMWEFNSRISRFIRISFFWNTENSKKIKGSNNVTSNAKRALIANITSIAPNK